MFEHMLLPTGGTHVVRRTTYALAGQLTVLTIGTVLIAYYDVLPLQFPQGAIPLYLSPPPPPPPAAPAPPRAAVQTPVSKVTPRTFTVVPLAPVTIPQHAALITDPEPAFQELPGAVIGGVPGGIPGGVPGGIPGGTLSGLGAPPPPPPLVAAKPAAPKPAAAAPARINVGGEVEEARLTHKVIPVYPVLAKNARIEGTVKLSAIIGPDGKVKDLRVLGGNPLLVEAAMNAVKQWVYQPTYLDGNPVEVATQINVEFHFARPGGSGAGVTAVASQ